MEQYSCKLLFQWNPFKDGEAFRKRRVCEEKIYSYPSKSPEDALAKAKALGEEECFDHETEEGHVYYQFVGVIELIQLIDYNEGTELWYEMSEKLIKDGNFEYLVPKEKELAVFKTDHKKKLVPW